MVNTYIGIAFMALISGGLLWIALRPTGPSDTDQINSENHVKA